MHRNVRQQCSGDRARLRVESLEDRVNPVAVGSPVPSFDADGRVVLDGLTAQFRDVAPAPGGKLIAVGTDRVFGMGFERDILVARLTSDGQLDPTFGDGGTKVIDLGGFDVGQSVVVLSDGTILIAGAGDDDFALVRVSADGQDVTTRTRDIDEDGQFDEAFGIAVDPGTGDIYLAGANIADSGDAEFAVAQYDATLTFLGDRDFQVGGDSEGFAVAVGPNGRVYVAGVTVASGNEQFVVARFDADLESGPITSETYSFGPERDVATRIAIDPATGDLFVAGYTTLAADPLDGFPTEVDAAVLRIAPDLTELERTTLDISEFDLPAGIDLDPFGRVVVTGLSGDFFAARLFPDTLQLDPSFDGDGIATVDFGGELASTFANGLVDLPSAGGTIDLAERVVIVGTLDTNPEGQFDPRPLAARLIGSVERPTSLSVGGTTGGRAEVVSTPDEIDAGPLAAARTTPASVFPGFAGEARTATGDFDGDGVEDTVLVTGPGTKTAMAVVSGKDNSVLLGATDPFGDPNFTFGGFVTSGDIDGDGRSEWVVTPELRGGPRVIIFHLLPDGSFDLTSPGQPSLVANFFGIGDPAFRDGDRAALGDVNNDGILDVFSIAAFNGGPRTALYDGADVLVARAAGRDPAKLVGDFFADPSGQDAGRGGRSITAGDVNGDGVADFIATGDNLLGTGNQVVIFSGADLIAGRVPGFGAAPLADFAVSGENPGALVSVAAIDADGDARADLAVGTGAAQPSSVKIYRGTDLAGTVEPDVLDLDPFAGAVLANGVFVG